MGGVGGEGVGSDVGGDAVVGEAVAPAVGNTILAVECRGGGRLHDSIVLAADEAGTVGSTLKVGSGGDGAGVGGGVAALVAVLHEVVSDTVGISVGGGLVCTGGRDRVRLHLSLVVLHVGGDALRGVGLATSGGGDGRVVGGVKACHVERAGERDGLCAQGDLSQTHGVVHGSVERGGGAVDDTFAYLQILCVESRFRGLVSRWFPIVDFVGEEGVGVRRSSGSHCRSRSIVGIVEEILIFGRSLHMLTLVAHRVVGIGPCRAVVGHGHVGVDDRIVLVNHIHAQLVVVDVCRLHVRGGCPCLGVHRLDAEFQSLACRELIDD